MKEKMAWILLAQSSTGVSGLNIMNYDILGQPNAKGADVLCPEK
jgi:hypothetical protein